jgi:hypothetical protein
LHDARFPFANAVPPSSLENKGFIASLAVSSGEQRDLQAK